MCVYFKAGECTLREKKNVYTKFGPHCKMANYDTIVDFMGRKIGPMGDHSLAELTVCNSGFSVLLSNSGYCVNDESVLCVANEEAFYFIFRNGIY